MGRLFLYSFGGEWEEWEAVNEVMNWEVMRMLGI
jgi:hypothetical protein